ncbi:hypothetical protein, partial [Cohnella yongneupensis]
KFAFGRIYGDASIAIYKDIGNSMSDLPMNEEYQFIVGIYKYALKTAGWLIVDHREFDNEEDKWPPPTKIIDQISGEYSIYYKGEIKPSSFDDCKDLETAAVWADNHIIDRIMGINTWHKE